MNRKKINEGDLFAIPLRKDVIAFGIVLSVSSVFKNTVLVGLFDKIFDSSEEIKIKLKAASLIEIPNYVVKQPLKIEDWIIVGNDFSQLARIAIPNLRIGNDLYYKDDFVRKISPQEYKQYEVLSVASQKFVEVKLCKYFGLD